MTEQLAARIATLLNAHPGATAKMLARLCNETGVSPPLTKRDLNPTLYRSEIFRSEGWTPPRWFLRTTRPEPIPPAVSDALRGKSDLPPRHIDPRASVGRISRRPPSKTVRRPAGRMVPDLEPRLYDWQRRAYAAWQAAGHCGIAEAVTGSGKTVLALQIIGRTVAAGGRCLVIVPSVTLLNQWETAIERELGIDDICLLGGGRGRDIRFDAPIVLGVINTVSNLACELEGAFDLLVADEVHRFGAAGRRAALLETVPSRLGLTATLERSDDGVENVLLPYFGGAFYRYDYAQAKADEVIAPFDVAFVRTELTEDERAVYDELTGTIRDLGRKLSRALGIRVTDRQFYAEVSKSTGRRDYVGGMAKAYVGAIGRRKALLCESEGKRSAIRNLSSAIAVATKTIVFCADIGTAESATQMLLKRRVCAETYHSKLSQGHRENILEDLQAGDIEAVVAVNALDEGVDVPDLDLGILVSGTSRRRQMIQRMGRIVRRKDDGRGAAFVVIYAADTSEDPTRNPDPEGYFGLLTQNASRVETFPDDDDLEEELEDFVDQAIFMPVVGTPSD